MDEVGDLVKWFRTVGLGQIRPWGSFFSEFRTPKFHDQKAMINSTWTNIVHFRANYVFIAAVLSLVQVMMNVRFLVAIVVILAGWTYVLYVRRFPIVVGDNRILTRREKVGALSAASVFVLWLFSSLLSVIWVTGFASLITLLHAGARHPTLKAKASEFMADMKVKRASTGDDIEDPEDDDDDVPRSSRAGPMPGRVENRARRAQNYAARRSALASKFPSIGGKHLNTHQ